MAKEVLAKKTVAAKKPVVKTVVAKKPAAKKPVAKAPAAKAPAQPTAVQLEKLGAYQDTLAGDQAAWRQQQNEEMQRINELNQNIYGESGQLKTFDTESEDARRRLAAQYAMRGMLESGGYGGSTRGAAVQQQKQQAIQRQGILDPLQSATNAERLGQLGLQTAPGVAGTPVTMQQNFNWLATNQGQAARARALQEARNSWLSGKVTV